MKLKYTYYIYILYIYIYVASWLGKIKLFKIKSRIKFKKYKYLKGINIIGDWRLIIIL